MKPDGIADPLEHWQLIGMGSPSTKSFATTKIYRYLQDPSKRIDWFDPIKYVSLSEDGGAYPSLGGLIRERYEYIHNPLWGQDP